MFFIEYRDPLFGVIVFFMMIFTITFISYWYKKFKRIDDDKSLQLFLKKFESNSIEVDLKEAIKTTLLSEKSWFLVADAYLIRGECDKSIEIYTTLLENQSKSDLKRKTMFLLGKAYFKAGFLERSKDVFLEILKNYPRSPEVLRYILLVFERLHLYRDALDVIEPMQMQKMSVGVDKEYLELLIIKNSKRDTNFKIEKFLEIYNHSYHLKRVVFEYLFKNDPAVAWENLDLSNVNSLVDILWNLDSEACNFDIISKSAFLSEFYSAKGYIQEAKSSTIFELNILIQLDKKVEATLGFTYLCSNCKEVSPLAFNRCMHCYAIDSINVEYYLKSSVYESMYSF